MALRLLPAARADIETIAFYIAAENPSVARRWVDRIEERCERLAEMPGLGVARPDVRLDLRLLPVGNYLILYREMGEDVEVVRVLHGARHWQDLV
jgi:toxin ParE1/3/4